KKQIAVIVPRHGVELDDLLQHGLRACHVLLPDVLRLRSERSLGRVLALDVSRLVTPIQPPSILDRKARESLVAAETARGMSGPEWVVQQLPADRDEIGLTVDEDLLGLLRMH